MIVPRKIRTKKQVKLIFTGGFLGSGKTTALAVIARKLIQQGMKVGIITNDQSENLADTVIIKQMLNELKVPVEEVVKGCFCCKFDTLIDHMEKILIQEPDVLLGEPVGSCTDFVAAVANPIKIYYKDAFQFAPFTTIVDPDRVRELLLGEADTTFPEDVSYLFKKQLEEADLIVLNKIDLIENSERNRLITAIENKYPGKKVIAVSSRDDREMDNWVDVLLSNRPGANKVLRQIDYDRYAKAEAVLGWLNGSVRISTHEAFDAGGFLIRLAVIIRNALREKDAGIGHLKFVLTSHGISMWANLTDLKGEPRAGDVNIGKIKKGTLIVNARVQQEPEDLETIVLDSIDRAVSEFNMQREINDLQCFSPAYPTPPYLTRKDVKLT